MTQLSGLPVVNINGTSRQELVDVRVEAIDAIRGAIKAISDCSPNGRDYQTAAKGEFEIARKKYVERFLFLNRLINELEEEAIAIQGQ
jgi:hypothetical protein